MKLADYPEIMTIEEVAEFLRLSERSILNWASEGKLPGGKIGSTWRFKKSDISKWVDSQITNKNIKKEDELYISSLIKREHIIFVDDKSKNEILNLLIENLAHTPFIQDKEEFSKAIYYRETLMSTGIGMQVGIPHVRLQSISDITIAIALSKTPVKDYESLDQKPVRIIIMIAANENQHTEHLRVLSDWSKKFKNNVYRELLLNSQDEDEFYRNLVSG